jgi:hypothetical protein
MNTYAFPPLTRLIARVAAWRDRLWWRLLRLRCAALLLTGRGSPAQRSAALRVLTARDSLDLAADLIAPPPANVVPLREEGGRR